MKFNGTVKKEINYDGKELIVIYHHDGSLEGALAKRDTVDETLRNFNYVRKHYGNVSDEYLNSIKVMVEKIF